MSSHRLLALATLLFTVCAFPDSKPAPPSGQQPLTAQTRTLLIRSLTAEFVWVRHVFPMGVKGLALKNGELQPGEREIEMLAAKNGVAAKPGDRAQITAVNIKNDSIIFEINGGGKKKTKWYQHIQVGAGGGVAQLPDDAAKPAKGSYLELQFSKFVPEMTGDQVRELLAPVFDFKAKSAAEAFIDTVPPKVKDAIKNHQVLVGMNREMVNYAKGRPERKLRDRDENGKEYEEWLYGAPPKEVEFVRFQGDQVVRLEIMKVDGEKVVRTEKEIDLQPTVAEKKTEEEPKRPAHAPSLRRPGEKADDASPAGNNPQTAPSEKPLPPLNLPPPPGPPGMPPTGPG